MCRDNGEGRGLSRVSGYSHGIDGSEEGGLVFLCCYFVQREGMFRCEACKQIGDGVFEEQFFVRSKMRDVDAVKGPKERNKPLVGRCKLSSDFVSAMGSFSSKGKLS